MMDIRPTSEQALEYIWFGRQCLDLARRSGRPGAKAIQDGRLLVICKYTLHHATLITLSQGDFTMHPRSGLMRSYPATAPHLEEIPGVPVYYDTMIPGINGGGWAQSGEGFSELAARSPYPLVDNDHGTFVISIDGEDLEVTWADQGDENYGNLWWQGTGDDPPVLSWRGPPSVQFGLPTTVSISGLTQEDSSGASTPFGCYIYADGSRIHGPKPIPDKLATLVVGACYTTDNNNRTWLVALCVTFRDKGYWFQVWRLKGNDWQMLWEDTATGPAQVPAFISPDGRIFVYDGIRYVLDDVVSRVELGDKMPHTGTGTRTVTGKGGYGSDYEFKGMGHCWPGMDENNALVFSSYTTNAIFRTSGYVEDKNPETKLLPVYRGNPATEIYIEKLGAELSPCSNVTELVDVFFASANGNYCELQWSGVDCSKDQLAARRRLRCPGAYSVTATILPQGIKASITVTKEVPELVVLGSKVPAVGNAYGASNAIGTIKWSASNATISDQGVLLSIADAACAVTIAAVDFCGRSGSFVADATDPPTITSVPDLAIGKYATASGGTPPYSWSASDGVIVNASTGQILGFTQCPSELLYTLTVTDACGRTAEKGCVKPVGVWVLTSTAKDTIGSCGSDCGVRILTNPTTYIKAYVYCCEKHNSTHANGDYLKSIMSAYRTGPNSCKKTRPSPIPRYIEGLGDWCCPQWIDCHDKFPTRYMSAQIEVYEYVCP